eukprot:CAMPEP_0173411102 /NCGR_PEP_ID=MMETSP1356-20130122/76184_1 /TAXON_ID=77927 ORGANISM="Hemiselmis virescens, Strain PCC157" /NCGR_SAMPLE_ID=MMETSP1356 /ASSEMBLY_ACC=CAM_ASM_000847 /LENGTH=439 /DNA_ID=CAMNT_0014372809 /DNA_START=49 /DNA_END=1366 /DNA_ORIENTATION=+
MAAWHNLWQQFGHTKACDRVELPLARPSIAERDVEFSVDQLRGRPTGVHHAEQDVEASRAEALMGIDGSKTTFENHLGALEAIKYALRGIQGGCAVEMAMHISEKLGVGGRLQPIIVNTYDHTLERTVGTSINFTKFTTTDSAATVEEQDQLAEFGRQCGATGSQQHIVSLVFQLSTTIWLHLNDFLHKHKDTLQCFKPICEIRTSELCGIVALATMVKKANGMQGTNLDRITSLRLDLIGPCSRNFSPPMFTSDGLLGRVAAIESQVNSFLVGTRLSLTPGEINSIMLSAAEALAEKSQELSKFGPQSFVVGQIASKLNKSIQEIIGDQRLLLKSVDYDPITPMLESITFAATELSRYEPKPSRTTGPPRDPSMQKLEHLKGFVAHEKRRNDKRFQELTVLYAARDRRTTLPPKYSNTRFGSKDVSRRGSVSSVGSGG